MSSLAFTNIKVRNLLLFWGYTSLARVGVPRRALLLLQSASLAGNTSKASILRIKDTVNTTAPTAVTISQTAADT